MTDRCRNCEHWRPLFTGEAWGVRSFADAPESERAAILKRISGRDEVYFPKWGPWVPAHYEYESISDRAEWSSYELADWPMWGECALTDMDNKPGTSLALAIDGSRYQAILRCHADFGCVQFKTERRSDAPPDAAREEGK